MAETARTGAITSEAGVVSGADTANRIPTGLLILGLGEGWHNNHHAFPTSARHGLRWWQIDISFEVIRLLALLRLAWNMRLPMQPKAAGRDRPVAARTHDAAAGIGEPRGISVGS